MKKLRQWFEKRRENYALLQELTGPIIHEFEVMSYEILSDPHQPLCYERQLGDVKLTWTVDVVRTKANGDIQVNMEFEANLPTLFGAMPAPHFYKRRDGSVYH